MKKVLIPSQALLHQLLDYNPTTGKLFWLFRPETMFNERRIARTWNSRFGGKEAFTAVGDDDYYRGSINYVSYLAHRVIFKYLHGYDPDQVDHDNRDRKDNRAFNLIDASAIDNSRNSKLYISNSTGFVGVYWDKQRQAWLAQITVNGRNIFLGRYEDINGAIAARNRAETRHSFHPNHGK